MKDGFIKAAAASPVIRVADTDYNADRVIECIAKAESEGVKVIVFPELTLTGASCYDLVTHNVLLKGAEKALVKVVKATEGKDVLAFVGLPFSPAGGALYSCAAAVWNGKLLGLVPRTEVSGTHYAPASELKVKVGPFDTTMSNNLLFASQVVPGLSVAVELGADANAIIAPADRHALAGASIIASMASFPATVYSTIDATEE